MPSEERGAFLMAIAHDLKCPLAVIAGNAEALLVERDPQEARELAEGIRDEAHRLAKLVSELLELERLEAGDLRANKAPIPLEDLIGSALAHLGARLERKKIEVALPEEIVLVPADPVLFEQVLLHLIENAAKHAPPDAPIEIRARASERAIAIEVLDRGPGFAPGEEARVFDKFYRGADRPPSSGSGLGLTICRAIVEAHGGTIRAESREGGGARLSIELPR